MEGDICPICNEGFLKDHFSENNGLKTEFSSCGYCGADIADSYQTARNKERKIEWDKKRKQNV